MRFILVISFFFAVILWSCSSPSGSPSTETLSSDSLHLISVQYTLQGMTCEGCEQTIVKGVGQMDGVEQAVASHTDSLAIVVIDTTRIKPDMIKAKIDTLGYTVTGYVKIN